MIKKILLSNAVPKIKPPTSRIFAFDVSGSMYGVLPKMKEHLKNTLFGKVPEGDDVSIIYFSGKGQCGLIAEGSHVDKIKDLKEIYDKIDGLHTIGLTGFLEPLKEIEKLIQRLPKNNNKEMFFLTDGYDNQWLESDILEQCKLLRHHVDNAYLVEYGWYCNRPLIQKMTEHLNAVHLFSEDYLTYTELAEKAVSEGVSKKIKIKVEDNLVKSNIIFYIYNNNVLTSTIDSEGYTLVPEDLDVYYYLENTAINEFLEPNLETYLALSTFANKRDSTTVYEILKKLGDVRFIKQYINTFGKQDITKFVDNVKSAIFQPNERMVNGCNYDLVPKEDAYNVLEMLQDLMEEGNLLYPNHPDFSYKKIGRSREVISVEDKVKILKEELLNTTDKEELKTQTEKLMNVLDTDNLEFTIKEEDKGVEISNLTWNENRPNVSVLIRREGEVVLPKNQFGLSKIDTFIFRNYTIIKDGILNMNVLPVSLNEKTFKKLQDNDLLKNEVYNKDKVYSLDFSQLPIINRKMVKSVSAKEVYQQQLDLESIKSKTKVFKYYLNELQPKTSIGWKANFGEEAVAWLAEMGLTEYNGFSPKVKLAESTDFYIGKSLEIKIKGLSSLPKVTDVETLLLNASPKLGIKDVAMAAAITEYQQFVSKLSNKETELLDKITFLNYKLTSLKKEDKEIMLKMSKIKFSTIIGQVWFIEFSNEDEDTKLELDYFNFKASVSAVLKDIEVKI